MFDSAEETEQREDLRFGRLLCLVHGMISKKATSPEDWFPNLKQKPKASLDPKIQAARQKMERDIMRAKFQRLANGS